MTHDKGGIRLTSVVEESGLRANDDLVNLVFIAIVATEG